MLLITDGYTAGIYRYLDICDIQSLIYEHECGGINQISSTYIIKWRYSLYKLCQILSSSNALSGYESL